MGGKKRLFIIGASDFGRELESWIDLNLCKSNDWKIEGFIDDNLDALKDYPSDYKILGTVRDYQFKKNDHVLLAIANPKIKEEIYNHLKLKVHFATYIADDAIIGKFSHIGEGSLICPGAKIGPNVKIGNVVTINSGTIIGHDAQIGNYCSIMSKVSISGHCRLGSNCYVGINAGLIPKRTVCENVTVGAGSVVINHLKKPGTVFGCPAKYI